MIQTLDLKFLKQDDTIAAFLLETDEGPVLFESGPHSTLPTLEKGLAEYDYKLSDIRHLFLTHIHFDHAGAAWALAKNGTQVYLHPFGVRHLHDPEKLYNSAKRIYQDKMEYLWGIMEGIPMDLLHPTEHLEEFTIGGIKIKSLHTPGHAVHHIAWQVGNEIIAGDVAGCKIAHGPVVPPCPPPDINIEDWKESIGLLIQVNPEALHLTHYGRITDVKNHLQDLSKILDDWANWIKPYFEEGVDPKLITPKFQAYARQQLIDAGVEDEATLNKYEGANPAWMSVAGLMRYWYKRSVS